MRCQVKVQLLFVVLVTQKLLQGYFLNDSIIAYVVGNTSATSLACFVSPFLKGIVNVVAAKDNTNFIKVFILYIPRYAENGLHDLRLSSPT